ncbi:MAG: AAA family ATPase [Dysgonamonadaceae bacterium]|jgi:exodeoxyribonuclease-5|nr:AAA family ATPase [Dysgonamonadaceae bacterium]
MQSDNLSKLIHKNFSFEPTDEQQEAIGKFCDFLLDGDNDSLFLLKGYAGTGKSSLIGAVVRTMNKIQQKPVLLAPTGRAAKVFASYAGQNAYTVHKKIYRRKELPDEPDCFVLTENTHTDTIFIVDEVSMISNDKRDSIFGSGHVLNDLIYYVYSIEGCRLILVGDSAQLPPVSQKESPALNTDVLKEYGLTVDEITLTQVVRQSQKSGILANATLLRQALDSGKTDVFPKIQTKQYPDIQIVTGTDLIECLEECHQRDGAEETIVISRYNKRTNRFNDGIRSHVLHREEELSNGDLLLVAKNNYFWTEQFKDRGFDFIANGDIMQVRKIGSTHEKYGFHFRDITAYFPYYNFEISLKILMETLHSETPALSKEDSDRLFYSVLEDYAGIKSKRDRMKKVKENQYYNAIQIKYAYAVTCHKAQGGQWRNVFLDIPYIQKEHLGVEFYRWLYTAFTRAKERIYLINPPENMLIK